MNNEIELRPEIILLLLTVDDSSRKKRKDVSISSKIVAYGKRIAITPIFLRVNSFPKVNANKTKIAILRKNPITLTQE